MRLPRIALAGCVLLGLAVTALAQTHRDDTLSASVDEVVRAQMREQKIPGVSLAVMRDGKIIKAGGYGLANVELNVPMAPQMLLHTESLAKAFTATAVMMLVEEGKIGLDDKIAKYLPEAPALWNEVTIRRLLTHTSGIRDYFGEDGDPTIDLHRGFTEDELVRGFAAQTMRFPTGEKWSYCNAGYVILGVVIHRVTGKFWLDFVKERIFDPLGMTSTRLISPDDIIMNRVSGYQMLNGEWKNEPWVSPEWKTADGTLYTNVFDMAKWDAALYTEKLIKHSSLEQMWTPVKLNNGTTYPYGFAWRIREVNGHRLIQHDGVGPAFTTRFARYVNDQLSIIIFMNLGEDDEAAMPIRMADNVAAIYIPGPGGSATKMADRAANVIEAPREINAGPEMDRLKFYIGDWAYTEEYPKSELFPNGGHNTGHWSAQRGPGGLSVINTFSSHGGGDNYQGMEVMIWDPKAKEYRDNALWYDSPDRWIFTGKFEGETLTYHGEFDYLGKRVKFRSETRPATGGGFTLTEFASVNGGPEQLLLVGRAAPKAGHLAPASGQALTAPTAANPDDVNTLDGIVAASYEALSGPVGTRRQWERYRSLLDPHAQLVSASVDATTGLPKIVRWNREEYAASADDYLVKTGFVDRKLGCTTSQYGNVATVRCGFEGLEQSKLVERGVAIYQLYNDGKRWWITSVVWDQERPGNPLPAELLTKK